MRFIFCSNPLNHKKVDQDYELEYNITKSLNKITNLIHLEDLLSNDMKSALKNIPSPESMEIAVYRGWMIKPNVYTKLYEELLKKNIRLINNPSEYKHAHHLPESYEVISNNTPKTIWFPEKEILNNIDKAIEEIKNTFRNRPIILKDYVKSRKHEWNECCFIADASDTQKVKDTILLLIERQGEELNEGIVVREFVKLEFLTNHSKSQMPLCKEYRLFFLNKKLISISNYWDEGIYDNKDINLDQFENIANNIKSNFFTMDIAKLENGHWIIIEIGDGQVSGLSDDVDLKMFYEKLK